MRLTKYGKNNGVLSMYGNAQCLKPNLLWILRFFVDFTAPNYGNRSHFNLSNLFRCFFFSSFVQCLSTCNVHAITVCIYIFSVFCNRRKSKCLCNKITIKKHDFVCLFIFFWSNYWTTGRRNIYIFIFEYGFFLLQQSITTI